jgi:hypothetical protein
MACSGSIVSVLNHDTLSISIYVYLYLFIYVYIIYVQYIFLCDPRKVYDSSPGLFRSAYYCNRGL